MTTVSTGGGGGAVGGLAHGSHTNSQMKDLTDLAKALTKQSTENDFDQTGSQDATGVTAPHYEVPILSSMLYDYTNKEQERIKKSFRTGNFIGLRDLPSNV